jgi:DMSO/TMAO reductase YedYZ molybdopterin-dependent catalytic subunit
MAAKVVRHNSDIGSEDKLPPENWKLQVTKKSGEVLHITLDELKTLPKTEIVFDFKCVEGWDQISHWGGIKFTDFIEHYKLHDEAKMNM